MNNLWGFALNIIILAIIPAIGEELLFRGYLQEKIGHLFGKMYISILITSFLFSIIHMDIHGLIPRFFLGVILGLLFFWSKSLFLCNVGSIESPNFVSNAPHGNGSLLLKRSCWR